MCLLCMHVSSHPLCTCSQLALLAVPPGSGTGSTGVRSAAWGQDTQKTQGPEGREDTGLERVVSQSASLLPLGSLTMHVH